MKIGPIVLSESLLYEFLNLSTGGQGPRFHQPSHFGMPAANELKNGSCILPVSSQEMKYEGWENEPSATISSLL